MKINKLEIENVKRVKAVRLEPTESGLTIIGGANEQGKSSVLDAIAWALGGNKFRPKDAQHNASTIPLNLKVTMNNGLVVERKGKNSDLKVTDPSGQKAGQQLLDSFVEELAIDLPRFMEASSKEKASILLKIIGVGDQLHELEEKETEIYNSRHAIGQIADQKEKFAKEQVYYPDAPKTLISASELIQKQQEILARNGENQRKRDSLESLNKKLEATEASISFILEKMKELENEKLKLEENKVTLLNDIAIANKTVEELQDESTAELEDSIRNIETINVKVRTNLDKEKAEDDAKEYREKYQELSVSLDKVREEKITLLQGADLPLEELSIRDGELVYKGFTWDGMSGEQKLRVSTAIVRKLKPECGFVLLDKLEQMDLDSLKAFGEWAEQEGLQVIATRVSSGEECSIIIEDGFVKGEEDIVLFPAPTAPWKAGEF